MGWRQIYTYSIGVIRVIDAVCGVLGATPDAHGRCRAGSRVVGGVFLGNG